MAWDPALFTLKHHFIRPNTITTVFICNASNLDFSVTNTYGPSDRAGSIPFLNGLREFTAQNLIQGPWILLGDFNLVRCAADKNNAQFSVSLSNAFNETIQALRLSEVSLSDRLFTWTNGQPHPILARLDRVFTTNDLDLIFPLTCLSSLPKPTSDHTPLLLSLSTNIPKSGFFRFERAWLRHQSFLPTVLAGWQ